MSFIFVKKDSLFVLMSVFSQFFLAFMSGNFSQFAFSSAGHLNSPDGRKIRRLKPYVKIMLKTLKKVNRRNFDNILTFFHVFNKFD